jgi:hypothetical protein
LIGWMMSILGFKVHKGFGLLSNTSTVGLQCLLEQYSNLPVWLDEFRDFQVEPMKLGMIRSCCYRDEPAKFRVEREIRTAFIVSGETTTQDAATRGRFPHVLVARSRRRANHMQWFQAHEQYFSMITRYILRHREEFIGLVMSALERWMSVDLEGVDERGKLIHGISAAAWFGAVGLFQSHSSDEVTAFRHFMEGYCQTSAVDVKDEFNVNIFFREMVNMFQEDGPDVLKYFFTEPDGVLPNAPGSTTQRNWVKRQLWFWADPVISAVQAFLRKRGSSLPLKQKDLRDQLGRNPYWLGAESKWLRDCGHSAHCWGLDLDLTPLGYQQVADDDPAYVAFTDHRGSDPRLGPLYGIVHALEQRHRPQA